MIIIIFCFNICLYCLQNILSRGEGMSTFSVFQIITWYCTLKSEKVNEHKVVSSFFNPIVHGVSRVALKHGWGGGGVNLPPLVKIPTTKAFNFKFGTHTH